MFRFKLNVPLLVTLIAAIALLIISWSTWQVIVQPDLGALWSDQGIVYFAASNSSLRTGDRIKAIDDLSLSEADFPYFSWQRGDIIQMDIERDGVEMELIAPYVNKAPPFILATRLSLVVVVLAFWGIGAILMLFSSSSFQQNLIFFLFCQVLGVGLALGNVTIQPWSAHLSPVLISLAVALAIHFHLLFPVNRVITLNRKWLYGIYAISFLGSTRLLIAFNVISLRSTFSAIYSFAFYVWMFVGLASVLVLLFKSYREAPSTAVKRQVGLVTVSGTLALTPLLIFSILPQILYDQTILPPEIAFIALISFPIGYGYAITHYQFIKLERYVSRSATVVFVISLLSLFYFGINAFLQANLHENLLTSPLVTLSIILIMVVIYNPLYGYLRDLVDSLLYGGWYDYPSVVREIGHKLDRNLVDVEDMVAVLSSTIQKSMRVYWSCLLWQGYKTNHSVVNTAGQTEAAFNNVHLNDLSTIITYMQQQLYPATSQEIRRALEGQQLSSEENNLLNYHSVRLWVPIRGLQRSMGLLILGPKYGGEGFDSNDMEILDTVSRQASVAFQNVQLINELQVKAYENEQYKKEIFRAREEERKRIARELHDLVIQTLVGLQYQIAHFQSSLNPTRGLIANDPIALDLQAEVRELIHTTRLLCQDLRPAALDLGLISSVRSLVSGFEVQHNIKVDLTLEGDRNIPIDEDVALCLFRCTSEALSNIGKHAMAQEVFVKLCIEPKEVSLAIVDDGQGFHVPNRLGSLMSQNHFGLVGMRERVKLLQGDFHISSRPLHGTHLEISIPLQNCDLREA